MHLPHFLHLDFWGLGERHRAYTLVVNNGETSLLKADGAAETDEEVVGAFDAYFATVPQPVSEGSHVLDYDVKAKQFHGLGTKHTKYRMKRSGEEYALYDADGEEVAEGAAFEAFIDMMDALTDDEYFSIPDDTEHQLDFDEETGEFRGFGGGDSGGGGASDDFSELAQSSASPETDEEATTDTLKTEAVSDSDQTANDGDQAADAAEPASDDEAADQPGDSGQQETEEIQAGGQITLEENPVSLVETFPAEPEPVPVYEPEPDTSSAFGGGDSGGDNE